MAELCFLLSFWVWRSVAYPGGMHRMHVHPPSPPVHPPPGHVHPPPPQPERWGSGQQEKNASLFTCDLIIFCRLFCINCMHFVEDGNRWPYFTSIYPSSMKRTHQIFMIFIVFSPKCRENTVLLQKLLQISLFQPTISHIAKEILIFFRTRFDPKYCRICSQIRSRWMGDIVDSGIGLSA